LSFPSISPTYQLAIQEQFEQSITTEKNYSTTTQKFIGACSASACMDEHPTVELCGQNSVVKFPQMPPANMGAIAFHLYGQQAESRVPRHAIDTTITCVATVAKNQQPSIFKCRHDNFFKNQRVDLAQIAQATRSQTRLPKTAHCAQYSARFPYVPLVIRQAGQTRRVDKT